MKHFGLGVWILTYREEFEVLQEKADNLLKAIADQTTLVATLIGHLPTYVDKIQKDLRGDLRKLSVSTNLGKMLVAAKGLIGNIDKEMDQLRKLQSECRTAHQQAAAAFPDYQKFYMNSNGRFPSGARIFFQSEKGGTATRLASPQQPSVPMASLSDVMLSRRFQR